MSDKTNGFLIRGEFTFPVPDDVLLPERVTHQDAMDYARALIESVGGQVVAREDSEIDRLRARVAELEAGVVHRQIESRSGQVWRRDIRVFTTPWVADVDGES